MTGTRHGNLWNVRGGRVDDRVSPLRRQTTTKTARIPRMLKAVPAHAVQPVKLSTQREDVWRTNRFKQTTLTRRNERCSESETEDTLPGGCQWHARGGAKRESKSSDATTSDALSFSWADRTEKRVVGCVNLSRLQPECCRTTARIQKRYTCRRWVLSLMMRGR
jgi:hypothetical protein